MDPAQVAQLVAGLGPEDLATLLNAGGVGFDAHVGLQYTWASPERVVATLSPGPEHAQPYGLVHGGVYCTAAEATCSVGAALCVLPQGRNAVGVENRTRFLRAARPGTRLTITATPLSEARGRHTWAAVIVDADGHRCAEAEVVVRALPPQARVGGETVHLERDLGD